MAENKKPCAYYHIAGAHHSYTNHIADPDGAIILSASQHINHFASWYILTADRSVLAG